MGTCLVYLLPIVIPEVSGRRRAPHSTNGVIPQPALYLESAREPAVLS